MRLFIEAHTKYSALELDILNFSKDLVLGKKLMLKACSNWFEQCSKTQAYTISCKVKVIGGKLERT
jgi:hypothetical protein